VAKEQKGLHDLFLDELRDVYDAEKQLIKALPKMAKASSSDELREAFESHLEETRTHVERLEQAFKLLNEPARGKHCAGIAGIIEEGSDLMEEDLEDAAMDAGLIAGGQRAEHYEITAYGSLIEWARTMGHDEVVTVLTETLEEEKAADQKLTQIAESGVNANANSDASMQPRKKVTGRPMPSRQSSRAGARQ